MLNLAVTVLAILASLSFAAAIVIIILWMTGTLTDTLYLEIPTFSGGYRSPSWAQILGFLLTLGLVLCVFAVFLARHR